MAGCAVANHTNIKRVQYAKHLFTDAARLRQFITNDGDQRQILLDLNAAQRGKFGQQSLGEQGIASRRRTGGIHGQRNAHFRRGDQIDGDTVTRQNTEYLGQKTAGTEHVRTLQGQQNLFAPQRDGAEQRVDQDAVVLGDIIVVTPGEQIVVDGEVAEASYLEMDESLLTGESEAVAKKPGDEVLSGSFVASGTGSYRATKVGKDSYAAKLTAEAAKFSLVHSDLQAGINAILKSITWVLIPVGILTIIGQVNVEHSDWRSIILAVSGALVPMIPEGLVLITSTAFAMGVIRLGRRKCLVNELPAIEGLARVDVVCADKTGTLTENKMEFSELIPLGSDASVTGSDDGVALGVLRQLAAADPAPNSSMEAIIEGVGTPDARWDVV